jgi:signal transduction histidine kinase
MHLWRGRWPAKQMKRNWISNLVVAGVILLLTVFLVLQYNWLSQASAAEQERMQKRVETDTKAFADEFNREVQAAYFNFQTGSETFENADYAEFNERYDFWKGRTAYPDLVRQIFFFPKDVNAKPLRYDVTGRTFVESESSGQLASIRSKLEGTAARTFIEGEDMFVLPIYPRDGPLERILIRTPASGERQKITMPEPAGRIVVLLDRKVITDRILPDLRAKYFADSEYRLSVLDGKNGAVVQDATAAGEPDASAELFSMTPENIVFFANRELALPRTEGAPRSAAIVNQRIESHTFSKLEAADGRMPGNFTVELQQNGGGARTRVFGAANAGNAGAEAWKLQISHSSGSIQSYVEGQKRRNLAIGLGVYLLLVGSILAIVFSSNRVRRYAQRQIDFVSSVSHEFRTPLAVIYSAGENLADGVAKDEGQVSRYGEMIKGEGKKLSGMVEQILEFAGARSGKRKYDLRPTDLKDIVADALNECAPIIEKRKVTVETDLPVSLPRVNADSSALSQAIQNLVANAVKYGNGEQWVRVSAINGGGTIKLSVEDRGIGISRSDIKHIFEPFYRSKEVVNAQIHGNGLGLALVKEIAEAHGGRVTAESEIGKGSRFTIELPLRNDGNA